VSAHSPHAFVDPRVLLGRHGLRPKRSFGQNFLVASAVVERIAELCTPAQSTHVVEIGAGLGTLTTALLARGARVDAIERDRELVPVLEKELEADLASKHLVLHEADAATFDYAPLFSPENQTHVLAGNLPYQITGRLLEVATTLRDRVARVVVMVQREVGERLAAAPSTKTYGQLTVFVQAAFDVKRAFLVSPGSFHPAPEVDSAVLVLTPHRVPRAEETKTFRAVVHAAFGARRKTLKNALGALIENDAIEAEVAREAIDLGRRGETLSVEEFARVASAIERGRAM
jgi:16S rRNA (adenine1518-N6/adenine1519-N6)-dimethyltransferase